MMTRSQVMGPLSVSTARIASEPFSASKPVTVTPVRIRTPSRSTLSARWYIAFVWLENPPRFSCSTLVIPCACQSPKMPRM